MAPKHRSSPNKKSPSKSPRGKEPSLTRGQKNERTSRKTSRSRSRSRATPQSRSSSRGRGSSSKKTASPVTKKFDDSAAVEVKKTVPVCRSSKNGSSFKVFPFSNKGVRRRVLTMRLLQPMNVNNLKVKGTKLKQRLFAHCKRFSRFYIIVAVLGLIGLGIFYTGYTLDQMAKYAREHMDIITGYVQRRG